MLRSQPGKEAVVWVESTDAGEFLQLQFPSLTNVMSGAQHQPRMKTRVE